MTETEFIQKAIELAKKGSLLVFIQESRAIEICRHMLYINAGFTLQDEVIDITWPSVVRRLTESATELKSLNVLISPDFHLKGIQIAKLKPDYVLDGRDYQPFEAEKTTPRASADKQ